MKKLKLKKKNVVKISQIVFLNFFFSRFVFSLFSCTFFLISVHISKNQIIEFIHEMFILLSWKFLRIKIEILYFLKTSLNIFIIHCDFVFFLIFFWFFLFLRSSITCVESFWTIIEFFTWKHLLSLDFSS